MSPREMRPAAVGLPGRIGRWSPEQRAAKMQREWAVRWLYENALIDLRTLQTAMGGQHNASQDVGAGRFRWWLKGSDTEANLRHLDGDHYRPGVPSKWGGRAEASRRPQPGDVAMPDPPPLKLHRIRSWLYVNGCESWKSLGRYDGDQRWGGTGPHLAARQRGANWWSTSDLDWLFPDLTCPPRTRARNPHGATMTQTAAIRIPNDLRDRLAIAADERGVSVTWIVAKLLDEALTDLRPAEEVRLTRHVA